MTAGRRAAVRADGVATALLAGPWHRRGMVRRVAVALGFQRAPRWVGTLVGQVLEAYRDAPADRPRELAAFVTTTEGWALGSAIRPPGVVRWQPRATAVVRRPFPVPDLADLHALTRLLDLDQGELAWFADVRNLERTSDEPLRHYRWRAVQRPSGVRLLAAPKPRLKEIQRRLLHHLLDPIPVHDAAHGCVPGRSVRTALAPHAGTGVVLHLDLEAFFASIPAARVWGLLQGTAGLTEPVAHAVTGLVTTVVPVEVWRRLPLPPGGEARDRHRRMGLRLAVPHLPQGAPTSPAVANRVCFRLDRRLTGLAAAHGAAYTRYVDDLVFSGEACGRLADRVTAVAADEGFRVHPGKTRAMRSSGRQHVLGAVVNTRPTPLRRDRDALRALLHNCAVHGWRSQTRGRDPETFRDHVLGRVAWAASLDPALGARLRALAAGIDWDEPGP
jgi:hypothetical protein